MTQFLLNQEAIEENTLAPSVSVLEWLRSHQQLKGTKEGCAAGDCGACTVVLAALDDDNKLSYRSCNACITPLGSIHGQQLITVEHLADGEQLHPVQQTMVDSHGSQCGFCTPGIVMSLFAWWQQTERQARASVPREAIEHALSGNLCRCTGYEPILRAAEVAAQHSAEDQFAQRKALTINSLSQFTNNNAKGHRKDEHCFLVPENKIELAQLLAQHKDARLVAGATDLALETTQNLVAERTLIHTKHVNELRVLADTPTELIIGAAVTYTEAQDLLSQYFPAFSRVIDRLGSMQIRNQATIGGNLANASPIGDCAPILLALNARVRLYSDQGLREVELSQFFLDYRQTDMRDKEFIESVIVPKPGDNQRLYAYKLSKRFDDDISAVCVAVQVQQKDGVTNDLRIGFGGMAAIPKRAYALEKALLGLPFDMPSLAQHQNLLDDDFSPISDVRASSAYRMETALTLLHRAVLEDQGEVVDLFSALNGPVQ